MKATDLTNPGAVKQASALDAVLSGGAGSIINGVAQSAFGSAPAWLVGAGEIAGGMLIGGMVGGKAGTIIQNGLVTVGGINLFNSLAAIVTGMTSGSSSKSSSTASANTTAGTLY